MRIELNDLHLGAPTTRYEAKHWPCGGARSSITQRHPRLRYTSIRLFFYEQSITQFTQFSVKTRFRLCKYNSVAYIATQISFTQLTNTVPFTKIVYCANVCFVAHWAYAIAQSCIHKTSEMFQSLNGVCDTYSYAVLNLDCWKCERIKSHCANCLVVLRSCALWGRP